MLSAEEVVQSTNTQVDNLKVMFCDSVFSHVVKYIQSGNVNPDIERSALE